MKLNDAISAVNAFRAAKRKDVVPPIIIIERAAICGACPKRVDSKGIVSNISKALGMLANRHRVPNEIKNFSCGVCGCNFTLLLPALDEDVHKDTVEERADRPEECWIRKIPK